MKTIIKSLGLKTVILCLFFVCTASLTAQTYSIKTASGHDIPPLTEGDTITFLLVDENGNEANIPNYDWTFLNEDTFEADTYNNQPTPYLTYTFDDPGTYVIDAIYGGGAAHLYIVVAPK